MCRLGLDATSSALSDGQRDLVPIMKACAAGLFIHAARLSEEARDVQTAAQSADAGPATTYRLVRSGGSEAAAVKLRIHHSSVLFRCRPTWILFYAAEQTDTGW